MPEKDTFANRREFWDKHPGLVWSNRNAPDDAFIAAALRDGRFLQLLDIAVEFGVDRLDRVWEILLSEGELSDLAIRHTEDTLRILRNANERVTAVRDRKALEPN